MNLFHSSVYELAVGSPDVTIANAVHEYVYCGVGDFKQVCHNLEYLISVVSLEPLISIHQYYHDSLKHVLAVQFNWVVTCN